METITRLGYSVCPTSFAFQPGHFSQRIEKKSVKLQLTHGSSGQQLAGLTGRDPLHQTLTVNKHPTLKLGRQFLYHSRLLKSGLVSRVERWM
jgi:hypothetical protein